MAASAARAALPAVHSLGQTHDALPPPARSLRPASQLPLHSQPDLSDTLARLIFRNGHNRSNLPALSIAFNPVAGIWLL